MRFKYDLITVGSKFDSNRGGPLADLCVSLQGVGLEISVAKDHFDLRVLGLELLEHLEGSPDSDHHATAHLLKHSVHVTDTLMEKAHTSIVPVLKSPEDLGVEHEERQESSSGRGRPLETLAQGNLIHQAQISSEPNDSHRFRRAICCVHGSFSSAEVTVLTARRPIDKAETSIQENPLPVAECNWITEGDAAIFDKKPSRA
jgi:hypothetical protein